MKALRQQIALMAPTTGRVLIYGESGTGKELVARAIHAGSLRNDDMFVEVNCAAIPEDLIESELFGHRKGSFAGAHHRQGRQISEGRRRHALPRRSRRHEPEDAVEGPAHARRRPLHARRRRRTSRLMSASSPPRTKISKKRSSKGNFREDLFYRLNVVPFFVPPLRERKEDIPVARATISSRSFRRHTAAARKRSPTTPSTRSCATPGRATCASCAT